MSESYQISYCHHCDCRTMFEDYICSECGRSMFSKGDEDNDNNSRDSLQRDDDSDNHRPWYLGRRTAGQ